MDWEKLQVMIFRNKQWMCVRNSHLRMRRTLEVASDSIVLQPRPIHIMNLLQFTRNPCLIFTDNFTQWSCSNLTSVDDRLLGSLRRRHTRFNHVVPAKTRPRFDQWELQLCIGMVTRTSRSQLPWSAVTSVHPDAGSELRYESSCVFLCSQALEVDGLSNDGRWVDTAVAIYV